MKKIVIGATEIEVLDLNAHVYDQGRGEKVLRITVDENTASFGDLKSALDGNEEPIQYFDDDALKCEYAGYTKFTATYADGKYKVEMHMASMETQMLLIAASNERITGENARISAENVALANAISGLQEENAQIKEENSQLSSDIEGLREENSELSSAVDGLKKENEELKEQVGSIDVSGGNGGGASWDEMAAAIEEGVNEV